MGEGEKIYPDKMNDPNHLRLYIESFFKASHYEIKAALFHKIARIVFDNKLQKQEIDFLKKKLQHHLNNQILMEIFLILRNDLDIYGKNYLNLLNEIEFPLNLDSELQKILLLNFDLKNEKVVDFIDSHINTIDKTNLSLFLSAFYQDIDHRSCIRLFAMMQYLAERKYINLSEVLCKFLLQNPECIRVDQILGKLTRKERMQFLTYITGSLTNATKKQIAKRIVCDTLSNLLQGIDIEFRKTILERYFNSYPAEFLDKNTFERLFPAFLIFEGDCPNNVADIASKIFCSDLERSFKVDFVSSLDPEILNELLKRYPEKMFSYFSGIEDCWFSENPEKIFLSHAKTILENNLNVKEYREPLLQCIQGEWNEIFSYLIPHYAYIKDEAFSLIPHNPKVSLFLYLATRKDPDSIEGLFDTRSFRIILEEFSWEENLLLIHTLFKKPDLLERFCDNYLSDCELHIDPTGYARHQYTELSYFFLRSLKKEMKIWKSKKRKSHSGESNTSSLKKRIALANKELFSPKIVSSLGKNIINKTPHKVLNRTLFFGNHDGGFDAFKFQKQGERPDCLTTEYKITQLISEESSVFSPPDPMEVLAIKSKYIPMQIKSCMKLVSLPAKTTLVYHYTLSNDHYMTYLNDPCLSDKVFEKARKAFLQKSAYLIKQGCFLPLADMFHNNKQDRAYHPLANLLYLNSASRRNNRGSGRLDQVMKAVAYPNVRLSGLADFGDIVTEKNYPGDSHMRHMPYRKHYIQLHERAKVILVDMLFLATRWKKQGRINWKDNETLENFAGLLKSGHQEFLTAYTGNEKLSQAIVDSNVYDWKAMARQIHFWFQNDQEGHPHYLDQGKLPENLYGNKVRASVNIRNAKNYVPGKGFQTDGELDLGCYNGPLALIEFEKMMNLSTLFVYAEELYTEYKEKCEEKHYFSSSFTKKRVYYPRYTHSISNYNLIVTSLCQMQGVNLQLTY